ncbi:hypothetical protein HWV62_23522 [Athelia sp. TMB]|nr:hypothetical protein HWV62_23522 [Athelia sp. TMB]
MNESSPRQLLNSWFDSTGVGYQTCKTLAQHGAKVYLAARNESKAKAAITQLHAEGLGDKAGGTRLT